MGSTSSDSSLPEGFKWIVGRKFKDDSNPAYPMPNDDQELARMDMQHFMTRTIFGNFMAPVKESLKRGIKVLDAGCGTGIWSIEMATEFPNSEFLATDITESYEATSTLAPANLTFSVADTRQLPFPDNTFDYVFQRMALGSFRTYEWPGAISELVRVTKPGGWVELFEAEKSPKNTGPIITEFFEKVDVMMEMRDMNLNYLFDHEDALEVVGLQEVQRVILSMPIGWGPEKTLAMSIQSVLELVQGMKPQMVLALGLGEDEYDEMINVIRAELRAYKQFWNHVSFYGRKHLPNQK